MVTCLNLFARRILFDWSTILSRQTTQRKAQHFPPTLAQTLAKSTEHRYPKWDGGIVLPFAYDDLECSPIARTPLCVLTRREFLIGIRTFKIERGQHIWSLLAPLFNYFCLTTIIELIWAQLRIESVKHLVLRFYPNIYRKSEKERELKKKLNRPSFSYYKFIWAGHSTLKKKNNLFR